LLESKKWLHGLSPYKAYGKLFLKIVITGATLYWVLRKLKWEEVGQTLQNANFLWLIPSLALLLTSKTASAFRMDILLRCIGLSLGKWRNTRLCFIGMYYNLFLPGGFGGDGYKVYLLKKHYDAPVKLLLSAMLVDRLGGVVALGVLVCMLAPFSSSASTYPYLSWMGTGCIALYFLYYFCLKKLFPSFLSSFWATNRYSLVVQGVQVICVITILLSLNVRVFYFDYAVLFLLSSLAAMLPLTIGGAGMREASLLYLPSLLAMPVAPSHAITMSLLFFLITVISSLPGAFILLGAKQKV